MLIRREMRSGVALTRRGLLALAAALGIAPLDARGRQRGAAAASPAALARDDGELVYVGRDPVRIKVSPSGGGRLAMITQDVSAGTSIPIHAHDREDEIIFIQSGTGEATLGDQKVSLEAGSTMFVPQGTWHGGRNTGSEILRWIAIYSPSGFEGYFREIGRPSPDAPPRPTTPEERSARDDRYAIRYR
jgi:mannose-6-phosphate isomerase-like protein (cupin superfamily)